MLLKIIPEVVTILIGEVEVGGKATIMEEVVGAAEEDMEGMEGNLVEEAHSRQSPRLLRQPLRKLQLMWRQKWNLHQHPQQTIRRNIELTGFHLKPNSNSFLKSRLYPQSLMNWKLTVTFTKIINYIAVLATKKLPQQLQMVAN